MAVVEVNHRILIEVADAIDLYCSAQDREMRSADADIKSMLSSDWAGYDAQVFDYKWEGVDGKNSTSYKLKISLENFSDGLRKCASIYKKAQEDSYTEANNLPKWLYW